MLVNRSALIVYLAVYTYGSKLETASPRFSRPADFYSYIIFLWVTILVSFKCIFDVFLLVLHTSYYLPAQSLIAVDGSWKRGRSPLHFDRSVIRNQSKGLFAV